MSDAEVSSHGEYIKRLFIERTENYDIPQLERLYTRIMKGIFETKAKGFEDGPRRLKRNKKEPKRRKKSCRDSNRNCDGQWHIPSPPTPSSTN
ncbi:hypothetical protein OIU77_002986 [Salix suchowensis]|uniref:Uncharacterized protein n=1 Tax=Salix suchowensis TaxID=1278906 RepID=A0ABQ9B059_9ROSI|nr:hypothetical protein OIU77_002986 [Salix suchowensis]